ncbi:signal peptide peptidase-like 2B isoform X1 [Tachypleus tridentatus]|uniref:signal peptide peptidase-like 2B isoform X1 n=1 Tax=Tachypleus tridentatus TaxID=6853 RepID=UPI003FD2A7D9
MLKSVRLPNLKICTLLLILLFLYDIFFVFVTPFLTVGCISLAEASSCSGDTHKNTYSVFQPRIKISLYLNIS